MEEQTRTEFAALIRWIHTKGWAPGTGGNFSFLMNRNPFRLLMTPSGVDKGNITPKDFIICDSNCDLESAIGIPSAEAKLHISILSQASASVVLHTHSIWNTLLSMEPVDEIELTGYEMLKGLAGNKSHLDIERIPILDNSQDMKLLSEKFLEIISLYPQLHAVLLRGHGLYTWGCDIFEARRHLEVLEFLFELHMRRSKKD